MYYVDQLASNRVLLSFENLKSGDFCLCCLYFVCTQPPVRLFKRVERDLRTARQYRHLPF